MISYIFKRLLLIIPTLVGILLINFLIIQLAPGGPVEQTVAKLTMASYSDTNVINYGSTNLNSTNTSQHTSTYAGSKGLDPEIIAEIEKQFGFDQPITTRFKNMLINYLQFDFGTSFFRGREVQTLIIERLPVSISLGLWSTLLIYLISIPLGIKKAVSDGSKFDLYTSIIIFIGYSIPSFLFALMLLLFFAKGGVFPFFPLSGIVSDNFSDLSPWGKVKDYFNHIFLPIIALVIGGFASLTMLTKNSFIAEFSKQYVLTARAKGLTEKKILYGHIFRNAMLLVISSLPSALVTIFFTGALLIEIIFSLSGLGLLGFEAALSRDYPVIFATVYIYTLIGLVFNLISDICYMLIDPRINFNKN